VPSVEKAMKGKEKKKNSGEPQMKLIRITRPSYRGTGGPATSKGEPLVAPLPKTRSKKSAPIPLGKKKTAS